MDFTQKQYFDELINIRKSKAGNLEKLSFSPNQANIIYELLQNADEAQATYAIFELQKARLIFKHNGKRHFTISNPATETEDLQSGKLGDINSITSISNYNQTNPKIGKYGVGFKSVFQYTTTPMIFDSIFRFQINTFVIPSLIAKDFFGRKSDETIFIIPFNNPAKNSTDCCKDISEKLTNLVSPTIFLNSISSVSFVLPDTTQKKFEKTTKLEHNFDDVKVQFIDLIDTVGDKKTNKRIWILSRQLKTYKISVGFYVNDDGFLTPSNDNIYSTFQIEQSSTMQFIINAPFLLTTDRLRIEPNHEHNLEMIKELAKLSAKSIMIFKQIGEQYNVRLINDDILKIIPLRTNKLFLPIFIEIQRVFMTEEIIPTAEGFVSKENAYWASDPKLIEVFDNEMLVKLVNNEKAKWVFTSVGVDICLENPTPPKILLYISSITQLRLDYDTLFKTEISLNNGTSSRTSSNKYGSPWGKNDQETPIDANNSSPKESNSTVSSKWGNSSGSAWGTNTNTEKSTYTNNSSSPESNGTISSLWANSWGSSWGNPSTWGQPNANSSGSAWGTNTNTEKSTYTNNSSSPESNDTISSSWANSWGSSWANSWGSSYGNSSGSTWGTTNATSSTATQNVKDSTPVFSGITASFIEEQNIEWLHRFYVWIGTKEKCIQLAKYSPILLNKEGKAISVYDSNNKLQLFFPIKTEANSKNVIETVSPTLLQNKETFTFMRKIGVTVPFLKDIILTSIIPKYSNKAGYIDTFQDFKKFFFFYKNCSFDDMEEFINKVKDIEFIMFFTKESSSTNRGKASSLYFPSSILLEYFEPIPSTRFIAIDEYKAIVGKNDEALLCEFFKKLGVRSIVNIVTYSVPHLIAMKYELPCPDSTDTVQWNETRLEGFEHIWNLIQKDPSKSIALWNVLLEYSKMGTLSEFTHGKYSYFYHVDHCLSYPSAFRKFLSTEKWLLTSNNEFVAPNEVFLKELPKKFYINDDGVSLLCEFLGIKNRNVEILTQEYIDDHNLVQRLRNEGLLPKVLNDLKAKEAQKK